MSSTQTSVPLVLNCTLKPSPAESNTEALARVVMDALEGNGVTTEIVRVVDHDVRPGVSSDEGDGDEWPAIRERIVNAEILVMATPTWLGKPSSVAQRAMERMDAMLSETDDDDRPLPTTGSPAWWSPATRTAPTT